jgi:hypothetical protein
MLLLMQVTILECSGSNSLAAGLRSDFTAGLIYCSPITKRLIVNKNKVPTERVQPLELDRRHVIDGVGVTLIDANHCPGAAMMLFEVPSGADGAPGKVRPASGITQLCGRCWQQHAPVYAGSSSVSSQPFLHCQ